MDPADLEIARAREALVQDGLPPTDAAVARLLAEKVSHLARGVSAGLLRLAPVKETKA